MKRNKYSVIGGLILLSAIAILSVHFNESNKGEKAPNNWFFAQRAFPYQSINQQAYLNAKEYTLKNFHNSSLRENAEWEFTGPENIEGRITDIEVNPENTQQIFIASAQGGVFVSENSGATWNPISDEIPSLSIGDIAIAASDPDIIYVGTGEANAGGGSLAYDGTGIYRSNDNGQNWTSIGLENSGSIGRIVVNPNNPDIVYVAAMGPLFSDGGQCGIFKSVDGGQNWEQSLFISDSTGAIDIVINPQNPDIIYAAMWERVRRPGRRSYGGPTSGIYKSLDGGQNWSELTNGLPSLSSEKGRIGIDIAASDPSIVYAVYADSIGYLQGIYKTLNGGDNWNDITNGIDSDAFASYGWWFGRIKVSPTNPATAYLIGFYLYRTNTGGSMWQNVSSWDVHVDQHAVAFHPQNDDVVYVGNDGGLYKSANGGNSWTWNKKLPITQFYTCEIDEQNPERIYGGAQDNGTNRTLTGQTDDWENIYGGDGFRVLVDPIDNKYVYAEYQYGGLGRSENGGDYFNPAVSGISSSDRFNWNSPLIFDPNNPSTLYFGSNKLYKSTNHAQSWQAISGDLTNGQGDGNIAYNTLTTISVSVLNNNYIYTGSDDGNVNFSVDGGQSWTNISAELPNRWVSSVAADPLDENTVYVTFSGYRWDEYIPHVLKSLDNGQTWIDISSNLPEAPVNEIIIDPAHIGWLYVATDMGVFYSENDGMKWEKLGSGIPDIVINDIRLYEQGRELIAATYGRGIYRLDLSLITSEEETQNTVAVKVYPNPFVNKLSVELPNEFIGKNINIELVDAGARNIMSLFQGKTTKTNLSFDVSNLKPTTYFLRIKSGKEISVVKLVKALN